jgi:hypothetical protein
MLEDLIKYVVSTMADPSVMLEHGRVMGYHLHTWIRVHTVDEDRNSFEWIVDFGAPGAVPRPLLLMPDSPLRKAYMKENGASA